MTFDDINRRATQTIKAEELNPRIKSDAFFSAIRNMQEITLCSKMKMVKQCPSSSYTITAGEKTAGVVLLTLNSQHFLDTGMEIVVSDAGADYDGTVKIMAGGNLGDTYDNNLKIQYTLSSGNASAITSGNVTVPALYNVRVNPEFKGIDYNKDKAATDAAKVNKFKVECLSVDSMWIVNDDGTKTQLRILTTEDRQNVKDQDILSDSEDFYGAVDFDGGSIYLESPVDLLGKQVEFWMRFCIPYIADAQVVSVKTADDATDISLMDSFIETIPSRFHERLISGIKYHIYKSLAELDPKYDGLRQLFKVEWETIDLPFVKQEANKHVSREEIDEVVPRGVFRAWRA